MQKLDFLSGTPKTFIFEKSSNKTNLGGVFTLIYLIIVLFIFLAYLVDYTVNPKYEVQLFSEHFYNYYREYIENKRKDAKLNPKLLVSFFYLGETSEKNESEFFVYQIVNVEEDGLIEFNEIYESFAKGFIFYIGYVCKNTSCLTPDTESDMFLFYLGYKGYEINLQNETSPLKQKRIIYYLVNYNNF